MTSAEPGQWFTDRTPYARGPMEAFTDPDVEEIVLMWSTQTGKTELLMNCIGFAIDQDPGPIMFVGPREPDAEMINTKRVQPMIRLSPALRRHLRGRSDDVQKQEIVLDHSILYFVGANSPPALASKPVRYLFPDEVDKYPQFSGREADPIKLARERTNTYRNRKIVISSTPTTLQGYIINEFNKTDRCRYFVPCPSCGHYQALTFGNVKWPEDQVNPEVIRDQALAWYSCEACAAKIQDRQKQAMMLAGIWVPDGCSVDKDGKLVGTRPVTRRRGFWINAIYSPWKSFSDVAAEFLSSKEKPNELMNFVNSWLAEVWEEKAAETSEGKIRSLALDYKPLEIPELAVVLTAFVDVQKDYFVYSIRAWGTGEESWLVSARRAETWDEIEKDILKTEFEGTGGFTAEVRLVLVDSGYRQGEVYDFCAKYPDRARPTKGREKLSGVPFQVSTLDRDPRTGHVLKNGLKLWIVDTTHYKDKLTRLIHAGDADTGSARWHIFSGAPDQYLQQMVSEHKIVKRDRKSGKVWEVWRQKSPGVRNDFWDTEVGNVAAADMLRVSTLRPQDVELIRRARIEAKPDQRQRQGGSGWVPRREGWMNR